MKPNDKPSLEDFKRLHAMYDSIQKHSKQLFNQDLGSEDFLENNILFESVIQKRLHKDYFHAQLKFIRALTSISTLLVNLKLPDKDLKGQALRLALKNLNKNKSFLKGVYIPIFTPSGVPYRVVHIPHHHAFPLNSRERVPYMLTLEVVSGYFESKFFEKSPSSSTKNPLEKSKSKENLGQQMEYQPNSGEEQDDFKVTKLVDSYKIINDWSSSKETSPPIMEAAFGATWEEKKEKIRQASPVGFLPGWDAISVIVKSGDDLRQEQLAMQMIQAFYEIFNEEKIPLWLNPYMVLSTSQDAGLIETVRDAISIDSLKKSTGVETLVAYFAKAYGSSDTAKYNQALRNFVESLAAYSIVCYLLQIKDRHNGNILIDRQAHIIHIDYGFMLSSSPGNLQFEKAPFKLPLEFVELMGGVSGDIFTYFKTLFRSGFVAVRKHYKKILSLVELMMNAGGGKMACFQMGEATMLNLKARFALTISDEEVLSFADNLVNESAGNWRTDAYDKYQQLTNNISQ
uniref:1-phosphatidylinositol 4-kinase n=1 Tax=Arcella intermedia TaxID=1963864 RepID=A0A6B2L1R5_9EUKA